MNELAVLETNKLYPIQADNVADRVDTALAKIAEMAPALTQTWNRSHSDATWNLMNMDHETDTRNLREIGATIQKRRDALVEARYAHAENLADAEIHSENADRLELNGEDALARKERILSEKFKAYALMKHEAIQGATKDISILKSNYDRIMARIIEKHGKFDETVFESEEKEYWIRRLFVQAMRDVRECGAIRSGAQRDLEQLGIEPLDALNEIQAYLGKVRGQLANGGVITREDRDRWVLLLVEKYMPHVERKASMFGDETGHLFKLEDSHDS